MLIIIRHKNVRDKQNFRQHFWQNTRNQLLFSKSRVKYIFLLLGVVYETEGIYKSILYFLTILLGIYNLTIYFNK